MQTPLPPESVDQFRVRFEALEAQIGRVIVGQTDVVRGALTGLLAGGHVLLEGVPGLGKTRLVKAIADSVHLRFQRVQCTPDLMPADIVGTHLLLEEGGRRELVFRPGPVFTQVLLADEINRATPKTQSALLEAMAEGSVTLGGTTHLLPRPFFVLATQNPLEMEGTYPLPEAQLDRFVAKVLVPFPTLDELSGIVDATTGLAESSASPVIDAEGLLAAQRVARGTVLAEPVKRYALRLVLASHPSPAASPEVRRWVRYGASPRGAQSLVLMARVQALLQGRGHVALEDIRAVAPAALRHRVLCSFEADAEGIGPDDVVAHLLGSVPEQEGAAGRALA